MPRRSNKREDVWRMIARGAPDECWPFTGGICNGYGLFTVAGQSLRAHRVVWELGNGPIPPGMFVCHKCDNPPCCNPAHLFLGTPRDNMQDKVRKGRHYSGGSRRHPPTKRCAVCGREFAPPTKHTARTKTCSKECRYASSAVALAAYHEGRSADGVR